MPRAGSWSAVALALSYIISYTSVVVLEVWKEKARGDADGCVARCVSDVICGCHGDPIDWPTRRQTSRESRRHYDYCPPLPRRLSHLSLSLSFSVLLFLSTALAPLPLDCSPLPLTLKLFSLSA